MRWRQPPESSREKEPEGWWKELYLLLSEEPEQRKKLSRILDACFYRYDGTHIQKAVSSILYGNSVSGSVTRLETYAACAYAQFITYGLRLTERVEYEFGSMDRGNFFHKALETVFQEMKKENLRPEQVDDTIRKKLVDSAITQAWRAERRHNSAGQRAKRLFCGTLAKDDG